MAATKKQQKCGYTKNDENIVDIIYETKYRSFKNGQHGEMPPKNHMEKTTGIFRTFLPKERHGTSGTDEQHGRGGGQRMTKGDIY